MCIKIIRIWFKIANLQISSTFDRYLPMTCPYFCFRTITSKCQWIFMKLGVCIDIMGIWFGIVYQPILTELSAPTSLYFSFQTITLNVDGFSRILLCALILWRSAFGLLMGKFLQFLTRVICLQHSYIFISFVCLLWGLTTQSTYWGYVDGGQFT